MDRTRPESGNRVMEHVGSYFGNVYFDHEEMRTIRDDAVKKAQLSIEPTTASTSDNKEVESSSGSPYNPWGVILGTQGCQGNLRQLQVRAI